MTVSSYYRFDEIEGQLGMAPNGRAKLFSESSFTKDLATRLDTLLDGKRILSLDVFDTLVLRDNSSEITRFFEVGGRMAEIASASSATSVSQIDAFVARQLGTKATYRASRVENGCREGSLTELHQTASRILTGNDGLAEDFVFAELQNESTRIVPNPFLVDYVGRYREAGGKVVLITDMYMHADHVETLLDMLGIASEDYDFLISSADTKVSKSSGGIFPLVEKEMEAQPDQFVHMGDSFRGDVAKPIAAGWQALHLPISEFDILERRHDHLATSAMLSSEHGLEFDIAMPR